MDVVNAKKAGAVFRLTYLHVGKVLLRAQQLTAMLMQWSTQAVCPVWR